VGTVKIKGTYNRQETLTVEICAGVANNGHKPAPFCVEVPQAPRHRILQLIRANSEDKYNPATGDIEQVLNQPRWFRAYVLELVRGWSGFTPEVLQRLAPLGVDEELDVPDLDADGCIPFDAVRIAFTDPADKRAYTLPEFVWMRALPRDFSDKIEEVNRRWQAAKDAAEREKKGNSVDLPA
jgi:hypothetical protein